MTSAARASVAVFPPPPAQYDARNEASFRADVARWLNEVASYPATAAGVPSGIDATKIEMLNVYSAAYTTLQQAWNVAQSAGWISGGVISAAAAPSTLGYDLFTDTAGLDIGSHTPTSGWTSWSQPFSGIMVIDNGTYSGTAVRGATAFNRHVWSGQDVTSVGNPFTVAALITRSNEDVGSASVGLIFRHKGVTVGAGEELIMLEIVSQATADKCTVRIVQRLNGSVSETHNLDTNFSWTKATTKRWIVYVNGANVTVSYENQDGSGLTSMGTTVLTTYYDDSSHLKIGIYTDLSSVATNSYWYLHDYYVYNGEYGGEGAPAGIDVTAGEGWLRSSASDVAALYSVEWAAVAGQTAPALSATKYVGVEWNAGAPQIVLKDTNTWDYQTAFPLGSVYNNAGSLVVTQAELSRYVPKGVRIGGTLYATGAATLASTLAVTGAATLASTLAVTGAATLSSTLTVTGAGAINAGLLVKGFTTAPLYYDAILAAENSALSGATPYGLSVYAGTIGGFTGTLSGAYVTATTTHTSGTASGVYGLWFTASASGSGGSTSAVNGIIGSANLYAGHTAGYVAVMNVQSPTIGGTVGTVYGLYINSISGGTSANYALRTSTGLVHFGDIVSFFGGATSSLDVAGHYLTFKRAGASYFDATDAAGYFVWRLTGSYTTIMTLTGSDVTATVPLKSNAYFYAHPTSTGAGLLYLDGYAGTPTIYTRRSDGTYSAKTAVPIYNSLGTWAGQGWDGSAWASGAAITFSTSEAWTGTGHGAYMSFFTTATGATTLTEVGLMTYTGFNLYTGNLNIAPLTSGGAAAYAYGRAGAGQIILRRGEGTRASTTALASSTNAAVVDLGGFDGSTWASGAAIYGISVNAWTGSDHSMKMVFFTVAAASTTLTGRWSIYDSGHFIPYADNTYNIGEAANRVKDIHAIGFKALGDYTIINPSSSSETAPTNMTAGIIVRRDAGTIPALNSASVAVFASSSAAGTNGFVHIVSGASGISALYFGDTASYSPGALAYDHSTDTLSVRAGDAIWLTLSSVGVFTLGAGGVEKVTDWGTTASNQTIGSGANKYCGTLSGDVTITVSLNEGQSAVLYVAATGAARTITWSGVTDWMTDEDNLVAAGNTYCYAFEKVSGTTFGWLLSADKATSAP